MPNSDLLSPWVRRFLLEYLVGERNLARNMQKSYRDTLQQFLPFVARSCPPTDRGASGGGCFASPHPSFPSGLGRELVAAGSPRKISASRRSIPSPDSSVCITRNTWNGSVRFRPSRRRRSRVRWSAYLEKDELDALLKAPD